MVTDCSSQCEEGGGEVSGCGLQGEEGGQVVTSPQTQDEGKVGARFPKRRKFAVLLSYCGKGYMGMQK